jgi:hypothetical protein
MSDTLTPDQEALFHQRLGAWTQALDDALHAAHPHTQVGGLHPTHFECQAPRPGQRYVRIVEVRNGKPSSVHAFYDQRTGEVYKAAGWKAPAQHVRYRLLDDASFADMLAQITAGDWSGRYLYLR